MASLRDGSPTSSSASSPPLLSDDEIQQLQSVAEQHPHTPVGTAAAAMQLTNFADLISDDELLEDDQIVDSTWSYKGKRNPSTGEIVRYRSRFCVRGDQEEQGVTDQPSALRARLRDDPDHLQV